MMFADIASLDPPGAEHCCNPGGEDLHAEIAHPEQDRRRNQFLIRTLCELGPDLTIPPRPSPS